MPPTSLLSGTHTNTLTILNVDLALLFTHRDTPTVTLSHPRPSMREKKLVDQEDVAYATLNDKKH